MERKHFFQESILKDWEVGWIFCIEILLFSSCWNVGSVWGVPVNSLHCAMGQ